MNTIFTVLNDKDTQLVITIISTTVAFILFFLSLFDRNITLKKRLDFINSYHIPEPILQKFLAHYPDLTDKQVQEVIKALKIYFKCYALKNEYIAMPSKVVDMLWHEFILNTREYQQFCQQAFRKFLHHTPTEIQSCSKQIATTKMQYGLQVIWLYSCEQQNIQSLKPVILPTLFAIDAKLNIPDGYYYDLKKSGENWGEEEFDVGCRY
jgi:hypothetical protein